MDQFTVPKFIEHEPKIVGPLTFKQFAFIGVAGVICFILYFTAPFFIFLLSTVVIMLAGSALAFLKSGGRSLPVVLKNLLAFSLKPKIFLWKKKGGLPPKIIKKQEMPAEDEETPALKIAGNSRLENLSTKIETGIKKD